MIMKKIKIGHFLSVILLCFCSIKLTEFLFTLNTAAELEQIFFFEQNLKDYPFLFWLNCFPI